MRLAELRGSLHAGRSAWMALWAMAAMAVLTLAGCGGSGDSPPPVAAIAAQPVDTAAAAGSTATFSVQALGVGVTYQWQTSLDGGATWTNLPGATSASYTTGPLTTADNGKRFRAVVTSSGISVNTSAVTLTVTPAVVAPAITVQPAAQTVTAPAAASFSVTATGTAPSYQWQRSTDSGTTYANIAGATAATYGTGATTTAMSGERYRVVVSNSAGSVTSSAAVLAVNPTPVAAAFTTQPTDQSVTVGAAAAFTVVATGTPAPTLQWQRSTDGGSTYTDIAGATTAVFNTGATTLAQNGERYRAIATNSAGTATSIVATLTVNPAPVAPAITTQPVSQAVAAPATATFTAAASGVPTPTWQWQVSTDGGATFANVTGATSASYTTPATTSADNGKRYRAVATNSAGSATTSAATLTVAAAGASWQGALRLNSPSGYNVGGARVAAAGDGRFIAAWLAWKSSDAQIFTSRYAPDTGWSTPELAARWTGTVSAYTRTVAVGIAPDGTAVLAWVAPSNGFDSVFASRQNLGGAWSAPNLLESEDGGRAYFPAVAVDGLGTATVAWVQEASTFRPSETARVTAARQARGEAWGLPQNIDLAAGGNGTSTDIHVAANASGAVIVGWSTNNDIGQYATANVWRGAAVGWAGSAILTAATSGNNSVVWDVGINDAGLAVAALDQVGGGVRNVLIAQNTATGWASAEEVDQTTDSSSFSSVAVAPDGSLHVAFRRSVFSGFGQEIWATKRVGAAGPWSPVERVSKSGLSSGEVRLRSDSSGNVMAAWTQNPGAGDVVVAAQRPSVGIWGTIAQVEVQTAVPSTFIWNGLAVSPSGQAAAAWIEGFNDTAEVWVNVYR